jgi:hypothetical protein
MEVGGVQTYDVAGFNHRPKEFALKTCTKKNKILFLE